MFAALVESSARAVRVDVDGIAFIISVFKALDSDTSALSARTTNCNGL